MTTPEDTRLLLLYAQIEDVQALLHEIQQEAISVVHHGNMPDAAAQLQDVLKSTEDAAQNILDAATAIQGIAMEDGMAAPVTERLNNEVTRIYEACSFQDLSGQRIKKVLRNMDLLEGKLSNLANTLKAQVGNDVVTPQAAEVTGDAALLNGPQFAEHAASQEDVDRLLKGDINPSTPASQADIDKLFS